MIVKGKLGKLALIFMTAVLAMSVGIASPERAAASVSDLDLAYRWAPVHYQDTDSSHYSADYLTGIDYDGDWNTLNNWEGLDVDPARLQAKVYYSIVETSTHWFIGYNFYHPRDWTDVDFFGIDQHENDMEGLIMSIRKDGTDYGKFEAMVTVFHSDFYSFTPAGGTYTNGQETIDGTALMMSYDGADHPVTFQEAKGHGLKAWDGNPYTNTDVVRYFPSKDTAGVPTGGNDRNVKYQLVDIFAPQGLWDHRFDPQTFASWGTFRGDNGATANSANAPWGFNDKDDGDVQRGDMARDPAKLISIYFGNLGSFSTVYTRNPFTDGIVYRLETSNFAGSYIRHKDARGRIDSNVTPFADSQWRMVPGLADPAGVSFESVNFPGEFLRHRNGEIWKDPYVGQPLFAADATFYRRDGLADSSLVSFESYNYPGKYIRHRNSLLYNETVSTNLDRSDATFRLQ